MYINDNHSVEKCAYLKVWAWQMAFDDAWEMACS
jgi:hypothetical protein